MNEAETRAEYIDPKLKVSGWGETEGSKKHHFIKKTACNLKYERHHIHLLWRPYKVYCLQ